MTKAFLANFCLLSHILGSTLRYCEALRAVRGLLQGMQPDEGEDDSPHEDDCYNPFVPDISVCDSVTSTDFPDSCDPDSSSQEGGCQVDAQNGEVIGCKTGDLAFADSEDDDLPFALPVEEEKPRLSSFKGTRGRESGRKIGFYRGGRTVCEEGPIIPSLVDGSWCSEDHRGRN